MNAALITADVTSSGHNPERLMVHCGLLGTYAYFCFKLGMQIIAKNQKLIQWKNIKL